MFKFSNFLVVDSGIDLDDLEVSYESSYSFTESGYIIFPINENVPLIQNGKCCALAKIKSITFTEDETTEVTFEIMSITRELANAYTVVYRGSGRTGRTYEDVYDTHMSTPIVGEADVNIVEEMSRKSKNKNKKRVNRW